jgi:transcriptional regulator with XRE-family HTH domain
MSRTRRGLTQAQLAKRAGCSVSYLSLLENNERDPGINTLKSISLALNLPLSILFFLAADKDELTGLDEDLINKLAKTALEFLEESNKQQSFL